MKKNLLRKWSLLLVPALLTYGKPNLVTLGSIIDNTVNTTREFDYFGKIKAVTSLIIHSCLNLKFSLWQRPKRDWPMRSVGKQCVSSAFGKVKHLINIILMRLWLSLSLVGFSLNLVLGDIISHLDVVPLAQLKFMIFWVSKEMNLKNLFNQTIKTLDGLFICKNWMIQIIMIFDQNY